MGVLCKLSMLQAVLRRALLFLRVYPQGRPLYALIENPLFEKSSLVLL